MFENLAFSTKEIHGVKKNHGNKAGYKYSRFRNPTDMAFDMKKGLECGIVLMNSLKISRLAVSLGDPETLIQYPDSMSHVIFSKEERLSAGISDGLMR